MLNLVLRLTPLLILLFMVLNILVHVTHAAGFEPGVFSGLTEGCAETERSCWYGVMPGTTRLRDSDRLMQAAGYQAQFPRGYAALYIRPDCSTLCAALVDVGLNQTVTWLELRNNDGNLRLGDLLATFGAPEGVMLAESGSARWCYRACRITVTAPRDATPFTLVDTLSFRMASDSRLLKPWRGFIPNWKRCQLETDLLGCL